MGAYKKVQECVGFQWDKHNIQKNWEKHKVSPAESEQAFFNKPLIIVKDIQHSQEEDRDQRKRHKEKVNTDRRLKCLI